jgi:hypothetical protein
MSSRTLAEECAVSNRTDVPMNWSEGRKAYADWFLGFMRIRQPLSILNLESTSLSRTVHRPSGASAARVPPESSVSFVGDLSNILVSC